MANPMFIAGAASVGSAVIGAEGERRAGEQEAAATQAAINEQRLGRESFERRTDPFRQFGAGAANELAALLGIARPPTDEELRIQREIADINRQIEAGPQFEEVGPGGIEGSLQGAAGLGGIRGLRENIRAGLSREGPGGFQAERRQLPFDAAALASRRDQLQSQLDTLAGERQQAIPSGQGSLLEQANPLVSFLRDQGFQDIQESAAAQGRLGTGGTLEDLTRFNTQIAATVVPQLQQQRFNQLFNVLGLGANAATGQGTAALSTAGNIGGLLQQGGINRAESTRGQTGSVQQGISDLAGTYAYFNTLNR